MQVLSIIIRLLPNPIFSRRHRRLVFITINYLGGIHEEDKLLPRKIDLNGPGGAYQLGLFDSTA